MGKRGEITAQKRTRGQLLDEVIFEIHDYILDGQPLPVIRLALKICAEKHGNNFAREVVEALDLKQRYPGEF